MRTSRPLAQLAFSSSYGAVAGSDIRFDQPVSLTMSTITAIARRMTTAAISRVKSFTESAPLRRMTTTRPIAMTPDEADSPARHRDVHGARDRDHRPAEQDDQVDVPADGGQVDEGHGEVLAANTELRDRRRDGVAAVLRGDRHAGQRDEEDADQGAGDHRDGARSRLQVVGDVAADDEAPGGDGGGDGCGEHRTAAPPGPGRSGVAASRCRSPTTSRRRWWVRLPS